MLKRKEFILGAAVGLTFAAAATAGGVISWPTANAQVAGVSGRIAPSAGASGLAFAPPQGAPLSFADIFDQVSPAVVQIEVESRVTAPQGGRLQIPGLPPGFGFQLPQPEEGAEPRTTQGTGSGFFVTADGYIVTNNHVVADAVEIKVTLSDGRELDAELVGRDQDTDLAVLKVAGGDFPFVEFEEDAQPRVGDWVLAVGNPFALGGTATAGIVSATARELGGIAQDNPYTDFLQIDAAINVGNSGGPTFDIYGRVIGVNSAIFSQSGGSIGIGFAIPASIAKPITDQLISGEAIERGYLGAQIGTLTDDQRESLGLRDDFEAAFISDVTEGAPADRAGLRPFDLVTSLNGEPIENSTELTRLVGASQPGSNLRMEILRDNRPLTVNVRSGTRPADIRAAFDQGTDDDTAAVEEPGSVAGVTVEGLTVTPLTEALRGRYDIPQRVEGLLVTQVAPTSRAARIPGFLPGVVIVQANGRSVQSAAELTAAVNAVRQAGRSSILLGMRAPQGNAPVLLPLSPAD